MNHQQLIRVLFGIMLALIITLVGFAWDAQSSRLDRIEQKVDFVVQQYSKIDGLEKQMVRLEKQLDALFMRP